ncbi:MBL fold metallo-hydrolase [Luteibaculum oceani]|uniref:MBL fold metallo-hydrolase n=1 Tax=Luteibaculum oceani TaxID=1294296 RepID=A0A5C6VE53_9FLAO|nr:MBL fold metallo-hydrolase [Luteibaculum oceani]TXC81328.1 MBL fold metallo-hydrolase [Luteibaculum oceani]
MNLHVIDTGFFKLDGGAMFGVVPKSLWNKRHPADENNMCTWAMRCLLIEDGDKLVLIDTGMGDKQSEKFFSFYYLQDTITLEQSLAKKGFHPDDITDVVLTHLHFDHCGGAVSLNASKGNFYPTFKNATYWSNSHHWEWAMYPNAREKASFLKDNFECLESSGQLKHLDVSDWIGNGPFPWMNILFVNGHTDKQMIPIIKYKEKQIVFTADLLPSIHHIPVAWVMAYDTRPLITLEERQRFLPEAVSNEYYLFLEHDAHHEMCTLKDSEKGVVLDKTLSLDEL